MTIEALGRSSAHASGEVSNIRLLNYNGNLQWTRDQTALRITMPSEKPCNYAFAVAIEGLNP